MKRLLFVLVSGACLADGVIIPRPMPDYTPRPLSIQGHRVAISIKGNYATTVVEESFYNPNDRQLEGDFIFPLPPGATVEKFAMMIDGKEMKAELLDAEKARGIYLDIVRQLKDPGLLEYVDRRTFRLRVFPIPARGTKDIKLSYGQLLEADDRIYEYVYPLDTERFSAEPIKEIVVKATIESDVPIKSVYCPSHKVDVIRKSETEVTVGYEATSIKPDADFKLFITREKSPVSLRLMSYKPSDEDGFFMFVAAPSVQEGKAMPKDICFVIDTSGSMQSEGEDRLTPAKNTLKYCVNRLGTADRFNVVRFATEADSLADRLVPADAEWKGKAVAYVDRFQAAGGTAIDEALTLALKSLSSKDRPAFVVFLTDGEPTIGLTAPQEILENFKRNNVAAARVFAFGIGDKVNTVLLDALAEQSRGFSDYILAKDTLEIKVSNFYDKIASPVLTSVTLEAIGVKTSGVYPRVLPDLFKGSELVVLGRYEGSGKGEMTLRAQAAGQAVVLSDKVEFAPSETKYDFIPRLWAQRKIAYLLDEIRQRGEAREVVDEITKLAKRYGIITPYTAYLVLEDQRQLAMREPSAPRLIEEGAMKEVGALARQDFEGAKRGVGGSAAKAAEALAGARYSVAPQATADRYSRIAEQTKIVGDKTFYFNGKAWVDSAFEGAKLPEVKIAYGSDEYFRLLQKEPAIGKYLSLGRAITVCFKGKVYVIADTAP